MEYKSTTAAVGDEELALHYDGICFTTKRRLCAGAKRREGTDKDAGGVSRRSTAGVGGAA
jgi:hypothetical protein